MDFPNRTARESGLAASRAELMSRMIGDLERKLQCELYYSSAALVLDLSEVIDRVLREVETTSGIARVRSIRAIPRGSRYPLVAHRIQREEDIASGRVCSRDTDLRRVRLIEYVEQSSPELQLLLFTNVEVLEEGDVEITSARSAYIERRLRWSGIRERRNRKLR